MTMLEQNIVWYEREHVLPGGNHRVLTYSPVYSGVDPTMEFRTMDGQFVRISGDVTLWAYLVPPGLNQQC